jgi:hypothetical protein
VSSESLLSFFLTVTKYSINNPDHIRAAGSHHIYSNHSMMHLILASASAKAFKHMENKDWKAVADMLSQGRLRKGLEEHHGVR